MAAALGCGLSLASASAWAQNTQVELFKTASAPNVLAGQQVTYTISANNLGPVASSSDTAVTDLLPAGETYVSSAATTGSIGVSGQTITWNVGAMALDAFQTLRITVIVNALPGTSVTNTASITGSNVPTTSSSATTNVIFLPPSLAMSFNPTTIAANRTSTLTYTIANPTPSGSLTGVGFNDTLPSGLVVATPNGVTGSCGGGTITATAGTGSVTLSGATLGPASTANASCTFTVNVAPTTNGVFSNSTQVTSNEAGAGNTATATLTVNALAPTLAMSFNPTTIVVNGTSTLTYTITNPNTSISQTNAGFNDILPAGLLVATPNGVTGSCGGGTITAIAGSGAVSLSSATLAANASCTFSVGVIGTTSGTKSNSTQVTSTQGNSTTVTATLAVNAANPPTLAMSFNPTTILVNGTSTLTYTIANPNGSSALTGVGFNDSFPAGLIVATPNGLAGSCGGGTITAIATAGTVTLSGATLMASASCTFSVNVTATSAGTKSNSTQATSNEGGSGSFVTVTLAVANGTSSNLTSSLDPSQFGQTVTFTATVAGSGGTPTGAVTFKDGAAVLGSTALSAGVASLATSSLTVGNHSITASYGGAASFGASTSAVLVQVVNTPTDSLKLRAMQVLAAPVVAQASGQAISGAIESAIGEAFGNGGVFMTPSAGGVRFNFAADPEAVPASVAGHAKDPFASVESSAPGARSLAGDPALRTDGSSSARVDDAVGALGYAGPVKAPPISARPPPDWLGWAEVHGAVLDHWSSPAALGAATGVPTLYGTQVNLLAGLTRKLTPDFLIGVLGGYETFDYRSDALQGRLTGDGWTAGSYLGWMLTPNIRFNTAVAYSGIGYDGTAGTASGSFGGHRLLASGGLTGSYQSFGFNIEPSARVFALWEHEDAYTDTLGTLQAARDFSTGRASGGVKVAYPIAWTPTTRISPYAGLYGDYYFNQDNAALVSLTAPTVPIPAIYVLDGWSARAVIGVTEQFAGGAQVTVGGERSGIGGNFALWTFRARASVPFTAQ